MKRWIPFLAILVLVPLLMGSSCNQTVVRDEIAYKSELELMSQMSMQSAASLKKLIALECACENGKFTTKDCEKAADLVLVIETRLPWHKAMSLYNAGITEERPPKNPPDIPAIETLCPAAPEPPPAAPAPAPAEEPAPAPAATEGGE